MNLGRVGLVLVVAGAAAGCGTGGTAGTSPAPARPAVSAPAFATSAAAARMRAAGYQPVTSPAGPVLWFRCRLAGGAWTVEAVNEQPGPVTLTRAALVFTDGTAVQAGQSAAYPDAGIVSILPGYAVVLVAGAPDSAAPAGTACTVAGWS